MLPQNIASLHATEARVPRTQNQNVPDDVRILIFQMWPFEALFRRTGILRIKSYVMSRTKPQDKIDIISSDRSRPPIIYKYRYRVALANVNDTFVYQHR